MPDLIGGRYRVTKSLRKTGFCETYIAQDTQLPGKPLCVVKQLKPQSNEEFVLDTARRLFDNEAKFLYKLGNHPQIPRLLAHLEVEDQFYLVQEFIEGKDLSQEEIASNQKPWSEQEIREFLIDVLSILGFVHQNHVIHRDIKPSNLIRRTTDGKIELIDFGAVKEITNMTLTEGQSNLSLTVAIGTPGYMAPEQQRGDPRFNSDIYALGMTAVQAITGSHPDQLPRDYNTGEIVWRDRANCGSELAKIIEKMVKNDFTQRYHNVHEVLRDLQVTPPSPPPSSTLPISPWWIAGIVALGLFAFLIPNIWGAIKALGYYQQGQQLTEQGEYEEAIAVYNQAIAIKPNFVQAWTNKGYAQGKLGRHLDKFSSCSQAANIAPNFAEAWSCRGLAKYDLQHYEESIEDYEKAIAIDPEFYRAWYNKGQVLLKLGRQEEAIAATRKVLSLEPNYYVAWTQICKAFLELQQYQEAKTNCEQSLAINPKHQETLQIMEKVNQKLQ